MAGLVTLGVKASAYAFEGDINFWSRTGYDGRNNNKENCSVVLTMWTGRPTVMPWMTGETQHLQVIRTEKDK